MRLFRSRGTINHQAGLMPSNGSASVELISLAHRNLKNTSESDITQINLAGLSSGSEFSSTVVVPRNRVLYAVNTYHLIIIITNLLDLPLYIFIVWQVIELSISLNAHEMYSPLVSSSSSLLPSTSSPMIVVDDSKLTGKSFPLKLIQDVLELVFIIGHSINIIIYLIFHNEFRAVVSNAGSKLLHLIRKR